MEAEGELEIPEGAVMMDMFAGRGLDFVVDCGTRVRLRDTPQPACISVGCMGIRDAAGALKGLQWTSTKCGRLAAVLKFQRHDSAIDMDSRASV